MKPARTLNTNPLMSIIGKQLVGAEVASEIELAVLICLDAAKRASATGAMCNSLTTHLMMSVAIWSHMGNRPLYDEAVAAFNALGRACARPTKLLDLTTGEYQAIRLAIRHYVLALPRIEIKLLTYAGELARKEMER